MLVVPIPLLCPRDRYVPLTLVTAAHSGRSDSNADPNPPPPLNFLGPVGVGVGVGVGVSLGELGRSGGGGSRVPQHTDLKIIPLSR